MYRGGVFIFAYFSNKLNMRILQLFLLLATSAVLLLASSCQSDNENKVKLPTPNAEIENEKALPPLPEIDLSTIKLTNEAVAGVYFGKLPCPNCEAIEYRLELFADGNYSDFVFYKGKDSEPTQSIGKYSFTTSNQINLGKYLPGMNLFAKTEAGLLMLNDDGTRMAGPHEKRYQLLPESSFAKKAASMDEQYYADGVDFYARGEKSVWRMELDYQSGYRFFLPNNEILEFDVVEPVALSDYAFEYKTSSRGGNLTLTLDFTNRCQDITSGDLLDCAVTAEITRNNGKTDVLKGCGNFTTYPEFFGTTWQLVSINKAPASIKNYENGLPTITFGKLQRDFRGEDGCNEIAGQYYLLGDKLMFNQFASTAVSCPNMTASRDFNFAIQGNMYSFVLYDGQLTFSNLKNTLVFTKKQ
jgi:heat shock protein HslJ